ncbi:hypothetical protein [Kineococcus sp. SYSU DK003]|uniref:hypothetical protein n=1 Tax=Kineococcus sp. SYSU DK003 TaxID=3383124 RepID=UPI003D7CB6B0
MTYPWTNPPAPVRRAGTAREAAEELARLRKVTAAESDFDNIVMETEERLASSHIAPTLSEATQPAEALQLHRVMRGIDKKLGPGHHMLQVLVARHLSLRASMHRMQQYLTLAESRVGDVSRALILTRMDKELAAFAQVRKSILDAAPAEVEALSKEVSALVGPNAGTPPPTLSAAELREECARSLDEAERRLAQLRAVAARGVKARALEEAAARHGQEQLRALAAGRVAGRSAEQSFRVRAIARFGDPAQLSEEFARRLKQHLGNNLPFLREIEDTATFFAEALGVAASARKSQLLRRYVENGLPVGADELKAIRGYLSNLRGLLPEEVAVRMQFMEGIFFKRAFEAMEAFPPQLRGQLTVETVNGPLWVDVGRGAKRQFGDGCLLLSGPEGQSAIIGLGEFKAGFDDDLLEQLFVRSDGRAVTSAVSFDAADGSKQSRKLTRVFTFAGHESVQITEAPLYIYGRPGGESAETAKAFEKMVENEMSSGREMWKLQLPFTMQQNAEFADVALKEAVRTLRKHTSWAR